LVSVDDLHLAFSQTGRFQAASFFSFLFTSFIFNIIQPFLKISFTSTADDGNINQPKMGPGQAWKDWTSADFDYQVLKDAESVSAGMETIFF